MSSSAPCVACAKTRAQGCRCTFTAQRMRLRIAICAGARLDRFYTPTDHYPRRRRRTLP